MKSTDTDTILDDELLVFTDIYATVDLRYRLTENCSVYNNVVLEIFVMIYYQREVTVNKDGKRVSDTVCDCGVFYFILV